MPENEEPIPVEPENEEPIPVEPENEEPIPIFPDQIPVEPEPEPVVEEVEEEAPEPYELPVPEPEPEPVVDMDEHGREPHPECGHYEYRDRWHASGPCSTCLKEIDKAYAADQPHPICGCLKPVWSFRQDGGPCGWCLKDIEREYGLVPDSRMNDPLPTADDFRKWRAPLLEQTDWVDTNPGRVSREPEGWIAALHAWREELFDITENMEGLRDLPPMPQRADFLQIS